MHGEDSTYVLPSSRVFEARVAYGWTRWEAAVNCENVFEARWFVDAPADKLALPAHPATPA